MATPESVALVHLVPRHFDTAIAPPSHLKPSFGAPYGYCEAVITCVRFPEDRADNERDQEASDEPPKKEKADVCHAGTQCLVDVEDLELSGGVEANTAAFRIVQEALTNVSRHASATQVEVSLTRKSDEFALEITDNGVGISDAALSDPGSLGLLGMRERAAALGWRLDIAKNLGAGTKVVLRIPYPPQQAPGDSG